jgi:hypothetical protein
VLLYVVARVFIIYFYFMFVMVINREVGGHVANMEVYKIHVKKFVRKLQRRRPLKRTRHSYGDKQGGGWSCSKYGSV